MTTPPAPQSVVVLISGRGSNMRALIDQSRARAPARPSETAPAYRIARVLSDRPAAAGLDIARKLGIEALCIAPEPPEPTDRGARGNREIYDRRLAAAIDACAPSLIVLAGFMRILSAEFVDRYAGRIVNIHPSLLPQYPGLHTHRRVLAAGDRVHGATVHFVTPELDGGPPIIQARVPVLPGDDEASLAARVQAAEHEIFPLAVRWYCEGRLRCRDGRAWLDGGPLSQPIQHHGAAPSQDC